MKVLFDTGSAGMYLITDDCKSTSCDSKLIKKYDSKSSVYFRKEKSDDRTEIQYGKGYISGDVASDKLCFRRPPE